MSGDLNQARDAIVQGIKTALPELRTCEPHGGRFAAGELARWSRKAPGVLVAALRIPAVRQDKSQLTEVQWGAFIVTKDSPQASRDQVALDYAEALVRVIRNQRWGLSGAQAPQNLSADNLFAAEIDRQGIALWAVTWRQAIALTLNDPATLADWTLYNATHQVGDGPVAQDQVNLPQE